MSGPSQGLVDSVRQRLLNRRVSKKSGKFHELLVRFGIERFLYRLSRSPHGDRYVVKGATLFNLWLDEPHRPTLDLDLAALLPETADDLAERLHMIFDQEDQEDGVTFDVSSLSITTIRGDTKGGLRAKFNGLLGSARLPLQIDVGFGDAIYPPPEIRDYPSLLDLPSPRVKVYAKETMIAEKFEAMVRRGRRNSRIKDFSDVAFLAFHTLFDGATLYQAVVQTFERQATPVESTDRPAALGSAFYRDAVNIERWDALAGENPPLAKLGSFPTVGDLLIAFLGPIWEALAREESWNSNWHPPGPWRSQK